MALRLGLLHGEDLVRLLDELDETVAGMFTVSQCDMTRAAGGGSRVRANLQANFDLEWITMRSTGEGT